MSDFAAAAMLRLIRRGLQLQGIEVPTSPATRGARVALADKRALAAALWQQHGPDTLARIGQAVHGADDEPALAALSLARDPADLLRRWQRLERFIHSRHRLRVEPAGNTRLRLQHESLDPSAPPSAAESLLVFGLLVALAGLCGVQDLRARVAGERRWRFDAHGWRRGGWPEALASWEWEWDECPTAPPSATPGTESRPGPASARETLARDPSRDWRVAALAAELGLSARSLQRHLAATGQSFSHLLAQVRAAHAARLLTGSTRALAEIGYMSGYADQAHFSREFKRDTALTPGRFRQQFSSVD